jgi:hypothetical protein
MVALQSNERGLTRSSVEEDKFQYPINLDFKDTWIISDSLQELQKPQEQQQHSIEVKRTNQVFYKYGLTSRNAENLFGEIVRKNNGVN